jgi:peptidoglycan/LPS O-acetylase OafA/YrhL
MAAAFSGRGELRAPPRLPLLAAALSIGGVVLLVAFPRESLPLSGKLANVGAAAGLALGGVILLENFAGRTWRWMSSRPVRWVGRHTYGIYLWHLVLMAELSRLFAGADDPAKTYALLLPLVLMASVAVGAISYKLVERPAMQLRHRGSRRSGAAAAEEAPPASPVAAPSTA